jgi:Arc/MetJ-type ribon-helix-helix transcriptional regulator
MTTLTLEIPEAMAAELDAAVESGWFESKAEAVRAALRDFTNRRQLALQEKQQFDDIVWAMKVAKTRS